MIMRLWHVYSAMWGYGMYISLCDDNGVMVCIYHYVMIMGLWYVYVALRRTPGALGILWPWFSYSTAIFWAIFCGRTLDALHPKHVILFLDVTSLMSAVTSCVMSQHRTCISHMTFYYKRSVNASVGGSGLWFVHLLGSTLSPETCVWLVPNACRS